MANRIIFIEGVSGVGKTTQTHLLCDKLRDAGHTYICHVEGDRRNPLDPFGGRYPPAISCDEFCKQYENQWHQYAERKPVQDSGLILDGTLFHHPINDMIRFYNASDDDILALVSLLARIIVPLNPVIIYLVTHDVRSRLTLARESRKETAPTEDMIRFWTNRKRIDSIVLENIPIRSHIYHVDHDWDIANDALLEQIINEC